VGIREWLHRHRVDPDPAKQYDQELESDRKQAERAVTASWRQAESVEKLRDKSGEVHRGMSRLREDNHFAPWLFRALGEDR
jgi:hypothetical protein